MYGLGVRVLFCESSSRVTTLPLTDSDVLQSAGTARAQARGGRGERRAQVSRGGADRCQDSAGEGQRPAVEEQRGAGERAQ